MTKPQSWQSTRPLMMIFALTILGCAVLAGTGWAQGNDRAGATFASSDRAALETQQRELAELLVARREAASGRQVDPAYRQWLVGAVSAQTPEKLQELLSAGDEGGPLLNTLGDSAADLVYTPVVPCRVFDTRYSTAGILVGNTQRNFLVAGSAGFPAQGGLTGGCGIPYGPATSVIINFAAVTPTGGGNIRAWAVASPQPAAPTAATMNFSASLVALANGLAVPICNTAVTSCALGDLRLQADNNSVHVVGDVVGYFSRVNTAQAVAVKSSGFQTSANITVSTTLTSIRTLTVNFPAAGQAIITAQSSWSAATTGQWLDCRLFENAVQVEDWYWEPGDNDTWFDNWQSTSIVRAVTAGSKTYDVQCRVNSGTSALSYQSELHVMFIGAALP